MWQHILPIYRQYATYFLITVPLGLLGLIYPWWEVPYALVFFAATLQLLFVKNDRVQYPQNSTRRHYEQNSRYTQYNFVPAALITVASVTLVFVPLNKAFLTLIFWSISLYIIWKWSQPVSETTLKKLIWDYLHLQYLSVSPDKLKKFVEYMHAHPIPNFDEVKEIVNQDEQITQKLIKSYLVYISQLETV